MYITQVYKYELDDVVYVGALEVPDGATLLETMDILNAEDGYELQRISDDEIVGNNIWLHDGDVTKNYTEVEIQLEPQSEEPEQTEE